MTSCSNRHDAPPPEDQEEVVKTHFKMYFECLSIWLLSQEVDIDIIQSEVGPGKASFNKKRLISKTT